jgi:hypothetical protein
MGTGFGVASLVVAILGYSVPIVTIYFVWLSLVLATLAGLCGNKVFPLATFFACLINLLIFSPVTWTALLGERMSGQSTLFTITVVLFVVSVASLLIGSFLGRNNAVIRTTSHITQPSIGDLFSDDDVTDQGALHLERRATSAESNMGFVDNNGDVADLDAYSRLGVKSGMKKCPMCAEFVKAEARICKHCRHLFSEEEVQKIVDELKDQRDKRARLLKEIDEYALTRLPELTLLEFAYDYQFNKHDFKRAGYYLTRLLTEYAEGEYASVARNRLAEMKPGCQACNGIQRSLLLAGLI